MKKWIWVGFLLCPLLLFSSCQSVPSVSSPKQVAGVPAQPSLKLLADQNLSFQPREMIPVLDKYVEGQKAATGLVVSFTNSSPLIFDNATGQFRQYAKGMGGHLDNECYTYDLALVIIYQLLAGNRDHAEFLLSAFETEFYKPKNGNFGLYNCYRADSDVGNGQLGLGIDGDRMHAGPTLWVALAALNHMKVYRSTRYLEFTLDMVEWCRSDLTYYYFEDGMRGAISMGFGWGPDWSEIFSTEHNIDYFAILRMLRDIWYQTQPEVREIYLEKNITIEWIEEEMECLGRWFREVVYNYDLQCFQAGVNPGGVDSLRILDGTSWGLEGVGPEYFVRWGFDLEKMVETASTLFRAEYTLPNGEVLVGIDFTDPEGYENAREPLFWFEGTGQFIIGIAELARYYEEKGDLTRAKKYFDLAADYTNDMYKFTSYFELDGGLPYMAIQPPELGPIVKTLKWEWEIPRGKDNQWVKSVSSTMWFGLTQYDYYNPMKWNLPK